MSKNRKNTTVSALLVGVLTIALAGAVLAAGTPSGTPVDNTATVGFSVSGTPQTAVPSNTVTFLVDNKIDLTVATTDLAIVSVMSAGLLGLAIWAFNRRD